MVVVVILRTSLLQVVLVVAALSITLVGTQVVALLALQERETVEAAHRNTQEETVTLAVAVERVKLAAMAFNPLAPAKEETAHSLQLLVLLLITAVVAAAVLGVLLQGQAAKVVALLARGQEALPRQEQLPTLVVVAVAMATAALTGAPVEAAAQA